MISLPSPYSAQNKPNQQETPQNLCVNITGFLFGEHSKKPSFPCLLGNCIYPIGIMVQDQIKQKEGAT
jgi:hypothetical protein